VGTRFVWETQREPIFHGQSWWHDQLPIPQAQAQAPAWDPQPMSPACRSLNVVNEKAVDAKAPKAWVRGFLVVLVLIYFISAAQLAVQHERLQHELLTTTAPPPGPESRSLLSLILTYALVPVVVVYKVSLQAVHPWLVLATTWSWTCVAASAVGVAAGHTVVAVAAFASATWSWTCTALGHTVVAVAAFARVMWDAACTIALLSFGTLSEAFGSAKGIVSSLCV
jgi:hypothetical protein